MKIAKVITGVASVGLVAAVVIGAAYLPQPRYDATPVPITQATAGSATLTCTGNIQRLIETNVNPDDTEEEISAWIGGFLPGNGAPLGGATRYVPLDTEAETAPSESAEDSDTDSPSGERSLGTNSAGLPITAEILPSSFASNTNLGQNQLLGAVTLDRSIVDLPQVMAGNAHLASAGDLRGVANNPCTWPTSSMWLVGGTTATGASNQLLLANPTGNSIQVTLSAYGTSGAVVFRGNPVVNIPAYSTQAVPLDGLVGSQERIALHLSAPAGRFSAAWQTTQLEGFTPRGIDVIKPSALGTDLMIPGIVLPAAPTPQDVIGEGEQAAEAAGEQGADGAEDPQSPENLEEPQALAQSDLVQEGYSAGLRIVNPTDSEAELSIWTIGEDGIEAPLPGAENTVIAPEAVLDLTLDGIPAGPNAVRITSESTITAAAYISYTTDAGTDFAWLPSADSLTQGSAAFGAVAAQLVVSPVHNQTQLTWHAYGDAGQELGSETELISGTVAIDLPENTHYLTVEAGQPFWGSISGRADLESDGGGIDSIPLLPALQQSAGSAIASR
ncbi:MAG: DUF5719 family protein [Actinomycetaceae bacterium]|nr:DUF5719 family protein [Arcanobacterium sp.]MDD7505171.1 DUF5719 family protein [Actinomycetaceae bacterium]MDY6143839.1 DUF5719 family protein [Arcanobacterium sp.]